MAVYNAHASEIADTLYIYKPGDSYEKKSDPKATMTISYVFEGRLADIKCYTGKITPSVVRAIGNDLRRKGVVRVEWRRHNTGKQRAKAYDVVTRLPVEPLFNLL